jgi:hypothetical protein
MPTVALTESAVFTALTTVLQGMLPGIEIIRGQDNRVPEPAAASFIEMWPLLRLRLATNIDTPTDCTFTGSISGPTLTVAAVLSGTILPNAPVFGPSVGVGTVITAFGSGTGGTGTYTVAPAQTIPSGPMAAGTSSNLQMTRFTVQLDVHGPASGDNAQIISTLFRDQYAVDAFAAANPAIAPLYTSDPRQLAFDNAEMQFETRYSIDLELQINPTVQVPVQFAGTLSVTPYPVDILQPVE